MFRFALLAALLMLAPLAAAAVDPHPRAEPAMTMDSAITAMATATSSGTIVAGRNDPTTTTGETPHLWRAWDADGGLRRSETADRANCTNNLLIDPCLGNVADVAVSADGARIVVAARDDQNVGRLVFATLSGGIVTRIELANEQPASVAISPDGTRIAVASSVPDGATGRVRLYGWSGAGAVASTWSADTALPATAVALGPDGRVSAAAGDRHYRFVTTGTAVASYMHDNDASLADVAYAGATAAHWSVAGAADGGVLLYSSLEETDTPSAREDLQSSTDPQATVAITNDGRLFAAGDSAGVVRLYRNLHLVSGTFPNVATSAALPGGVADLRFSLDGRYLVAGAGPATVLFRVSDTAMAEVWRHTSGSTVVDVGVNSDGTLVASAAGTAVTMFTTVRSALLTAAGNGTIQPGAPAQATLTVRNTGNREETITLDPPVAPAGWTATLSRTSFTLAPDATATTLLNVTAPGAAAPGVAKVTITQRQAGASSVATDVRFTVAQRHAWSLEAIGGISRDIEAGQTINVPFKATNAGNGADTTTVTVGIDRTGWTATVTTPLAAGAGQVAYGNITVTAPAGAQDLDSAVATVRLGADAAATLGVTVTVGARFGLDLAVTPGDGSAEPGKPLSFKVRITNTGNVPDTYLVTSSGLPNGWSLTKVPASSTTPSVAPGASTEVTFQVASIGSTDAGNYVIDLEATSQGDPGQTRNGEFVVRVQEDSESGTPSKSSKKGPGVEIGLAVLALAALALARRRS